METLQITLPLTIDKHVTKIVDGDGDHLLDIRGYEAFTDKGLDPDEAEAAQEVMANVVVMRCNEYPAMASAVDELKEKLRHAELEKAKLEQDLCDANEAAGSELADAIIDKVKAEDELSQMNKQLEATTLMLESEKDKAKGYKDLVDEYTQVLKDLRNCLAGKETPAKMTQTVERLESLEL